jgi:phage gpG-like protein
MIEVEIDATKVIAHFEAMPDKLHRAVLDKIYYLAVLLEQNVKAGMQGERIGYVTGELFSSIFNEVTDGESQIEGKVASSASSKAAPYARIQEFGGQTKAHVIEAVNAKSLFFTINGQGVFAKRVNHPGSSIPARRYIGAPFDELKPQVAEQLKQATLEGMS